MYITKILIRLLTLGYFNQCWRCRKWLPYYHFRPNGKYSECLDCMIQPRYSDDWKEFNRSIYFGPKIISFLIPRGYKDYILGDLEEECWEVYTTDGPKVARRWYYRHLFSSLLPLYKHLFIDWLDRRLTR